MENSLTCLDHLTVVTDIVQWLLDWSIDCIFYVRYVEYIIYDWSEHKVLLPSVKYFNVVREAAPHLPSSTNCCVSLSLEFSF